MGTQRSIGIKMLLALLGFILSIFMFVIFMYWMAWLEYSDQQLRTHCARIEGTIVKTQQGLHCSSHKLWNKDK